MKRIILVIAVVVSLGIVCGISAPPASAFCLGGNGLGGLGGNGLGGLGGLGGLFGSFWGGTTSNCGYGHGYGYGGYGYGGYGYGYGVPYYGGYGCCPPHPGKVWKKRAKAHMKKMKKMK